MLQEAFENTSQSFTSVYTDLKQDHARINGILDASKQLLADGEKLLSGEVTSKSNRHDIVKKLRNLLAYTMIDLKAWWIDEYLKAAEACGCNIKLLQVGYALTDEEYWNWTKETNRNITEDSHVLKIALFVGSWMILEIGWPLLVVFGVATAGSVWSIPATIPCLFIAMYGTVLVSGTNVVRSLIVQLGNRRDNLVKALFRGYFGSLLSIAVVLIVHTYFLSHMPLLFRLPIVYLLPIDGSVLGTGGTVPIPIPIGYSGLYMDLLVTIIVYAVGVTGSCIGSIEILQYLLRASREHGSYGAILGVLILAVFPAMNIYFSLVFLTSTLDLFGRCISLGV